MKTFKLLLTFLLLISFSQISVAADITIEENDWVVQYKEDSKTFDYTYKGKSIFVNAYPEAKYDVSGMTNVVATPSSYDKASLSEEPINDNFGTGRVYIVTFRNEESTVSLEQRFYFYDQYAYFLTDLRLVGSAEIKSNYLAPIVSVSSVGILPKNVDNRMLFVPWDNDGFVRYESNKLNTEKTSYGVTSVYNGNSRTGLVVGAIEHDTWKSAIRIKASDNEKMNEFYCYSGASSDITRDVLPHGKVKGNTVRSSKMLVGYFDDWRVGMEAYGHANTLIIPARTTWKKGTPFGWNSWGVIAEKITYTNVNDVSNFLRDSLFDKGFHNEQGDVIVDLDSFWNDNIGEGNLVSFAKNCKKRGQTPGIYWGPFSYWGWDDSSLDRQVVPGSQYTWRDCVLHTNGTPHKQGGYCLDGTHPGVREYIDFEMDRFKKWGFEYIKLDFISNGAVQADSYYNPDVTTGVQAYNEGFQYVIDKAGDDMFLAFSIAPIFPYQYGNSRRVSCDAWGSIGHSEYVLNALSFGWWTDQFYQYNDPDHLVLRSEGGKETEGENRARVTSGAITGMFLCGDNFSFNSQRGDPAVSRARALTMLTNPGINDIARLGTSFMPVYGHKAPHNGAENFFMHHTEDYLYVACINYTSGTIMSGTMNFNVLGIDPNDVASIKELWRDTDVAIKGDEGFNYGVPPSDARVYRIAKKSGPGISIEETKLDADKSVVKISRTQDSLILSSSEEMKRVTMFDINGSLIGTEDAQYLTEKEVNIKAYISGIYFIKVDFSELAPQVLKVIIN